MEIDKEKLAQAKLEVAQRLEQAEKQRARLRLVKGLNQLKKHEFAILLNDQFVEEFTRYLCESDSLQERDALMLVLGDIGAGCCSDSREVRERALVVLSVFSEYALEIDNFDLIRKLSDILCKWLEREDEYLSGFVIICQQIQKIGVKLLLNDCWGEIENLLVLLNRIQDGTLGKSNTIKGMAAKILENLATKNVLRLLTETYLDTLKKGHKRAGRLLKNLGRRSVIYLLNNLMHSKDKTERFRLMGLIPQTGTAVASVFEECLGKNPPWYVIRNVISMISEIGDTSLFYLVEEGLHHHDIRVQQEVVACIEKLGGSEMKNRLLLALRNADDELKAGVVMKLSQFTGSDVTTSLVELFEKRTTFADSVVDELLSVLCIAMKSFPNRRTVQSLRRFVEERKGNSTTPDRLLLIAEESLSEIEPKVRHDLKGEVNVLDELSFDEDPISEHEAKRKIRDLLDEVQQMVGKGNIGKASELLYTEAVGAAKNKDFRVAEILRDRILEINPIALAEVLEVGEIIEEEKSTSISSHHIEIWSELYEKMSTEEFNGLYSALKKETYNPGETIIKNGETDPCLFFINSGVVRLSCMCGNKETFLKRMQPGEIIGVGPFFTLSVWTVSLISQNTTQIHVLEQERFKRLRERFPEIEAKLHEYCIKFDTVPTLLRMAGEDRREYARYTLPLYVSSVTLDPYGRKRQYALEGEMIDISRGGLSFLLRISRGVNTKFLLGRQIISEIRLDRKDNLKCAGVIVGVGFSKPENRDFSIHVKFSNLMRQADFVRVSRIS
jgi:Cyclic nucleotide-binding domain/PilZ domain